MEHSIFAPRRQESDARDYFDNDKVNRKRLNADWKRTSHKSRFRKLIARSDAGAAADPSELEEELEEIKQALERQYAVICRAFQYFCMTGNALGEGCYSMSLNQWTAFLQDAEIPEQASAECKMKDLDTMFISTNFEDDKNDEASKVNDDLALMRFEFLEIIVRIAIAKYGKGVATDDVSDAVDILCERSIGPCLCEEAALDPNVFRRERLYCEEVAEVLEGHETLLRALYSFFKAKSRTKLMGMEDFVAFAELSGLTGARTGVSKRELKLCFGWAQMCVVDEIKRRDRVIGLTFIDFLDALGRLSDLISPPTPEELETYFHETNRADTETLVWEYFREVPEAEAEERRRPSSEFTVPKTRPLAVKLAQVIEVVSTELCHQWGVSTVTALTRKLNSMAKAMGGR